MSSVNQSGVQENDSQVFSIKESIQLHKLKTKYLNTVIDVAESWLMHKEEAQPALRYLSNRLDTKYHNIFRFGYFPNQLQSIYEFMDDIHVKLPKVDPEVVLKMTNIVEFGKRKNKIFYYNHPLLIPYFDMYGNPVSIVGRNLLSERDMKAQNVSKYKNLPFHKNQHLFCLNLSRYNMVRRGFGIVVEGQFDVISSIAHGLDNTVGLCGSKIDRAHVLLLRRYTKVLWFLLDNDEAGEKGWKAIQSKAKEYDIIVKRLLLPKEYKDPHEFVTNDENAVRYLLSQTH